MKHIITKSLLILCILFAWISLAAEYYDSVINLTGPSLYQGLRNLISTNTYSNYTGAKTFLFQTLDNVNGTVKCIYTGQTYSIDSSYNGSNDPNTEHTYAQSWFSDSELSVKKADVHHLFVSNAVVNSSRGNLPLFTVANHSTANVYYNNTPLQSYRGNSSGGWQVFEPANANKGNIARALLYFNTRYGDSLTQQNVNMIPDLVAWHYADPPDAAEIQRNQLLHSFLSNRNPFIDHPEFVNRIWGPVESSDELLSGISPLKIDKVYPNPFRDQLTIGMVAEKSGPVTTRIYNSKGQTVYTTTAFLPAGKQEFTYDARKDGGSALPSGVYFVRIEKDGYAAVAKVLLIR
ncbi:MAG TPA: endonuclease [Candidatus Cloacimonadota bacterium]|nr:endonuclease [Candidatus Cloacimonadota bacterium]